MEKKELDYILKKAEKELRDALLEYDDVDVGRKELLRKEKKGLILDKFNTNEEIKFVNKNYDEILKKVYNDSFKQPEIENDTSNKRRGATVFWVHFYCTFYYFIILVVSVVEGVFIEFVLVFLGIVIGLYFTRKREKFIYYSIFFYVLGFIILMIITKFKY